MSARSTILLLNGVGSVGKSTIARALQRRLAAPFLHVQMDQWLDMLPEDRQDDPSTFAFVAVGSAEEPSIAIRSGPDGDLLMAGFRASVAAMADAGNNLIVDDVMLAAGTAEDYRSRLAAHDLRIVGLHAPLPVLEERERSRGDRLPGLARWQFDRVHAGQRYDLELDTAQLSPRACAERIIAAFGLDAAQDDFSAKNLAQH